MLHFMIGLGILGAIGRRCYQRLALPAVQRDV
jgi:hypothetical protein